MSGDGRQSIDTVTKLADGHDAEKDAIFVDGGEGSDNWIYRQK